mmetsp:Transcript_13076/g.36785  ORF Transcript_13076/g.36785 Transcript_13076/m.36785 type:complete len:339 (-) Transcript_13076:299-1315(-)
MLTLKLHCGRSSFSGQRVARPAPSGRTSSLAPRSARPTTATVQSEVKGNSDESKTKAVYKRPLKNKEKADVYIGKGKIIRDDPAKYPDRDELTGGWAGGELGLWQFREEAKADAKTGEKGQSQGLDISKVTDFLGLKDGDEKMAFTAKVNGKEVKGVVRGDGKDVIYIGKETFIKDEGRKYPDKEDIGLLYGATGGFAGGEEGLKKYIETGEIPLAPPGKKGRTQVSPLLFVFGAGAVATVAATFSLVGAGGGGLPTEVAAGGARIAAGPVDVAALASSTSMPTKIAAGGAGVLLIGFATKSAMQSTLEKAKAAVDSTARNALFVGLLVLALKAVLDS